MEDQSKRPKAVSITAFLPYPGVPHAGGEYVLRHLTALTAEYDLTIVAPESEASEAARRFAASQGWHLLTISDNSSLPSPIRRIRSILHKAHSGSAYEPHVEGAFRNSELIEGVCRDASIVDLQWLQSARLGRQVRAWNPKARQVFIVHDVLTNRWQRSIEAASGWRKLYFWARKLFAERAERRIFADVDSVVTFSASDRDAVKRIQPRSRAAFVAPPLVDSAMPVSEEELDALSVRRGDSRVLLTAAFARPENDEAATWLLRSVWPLVLDRAPQARLVLAGAGPSDALRELAKDNMVEVTGYVEDLHDYYRTADLFVVPLRRGAGVKFKTITAMLWAIPVVSTPTGAEGIGERGNYVDVTSDSEAFAEAIVSALQERPAAMIKSTWLWAHSTYGVEVFEDRVRELYAP